MSDYAGETIEIIEPWLYATISNDQTILDLLGGPDHIGSTLDSDKPPPLDQISGTLSDTELQVPYVSMSYQSARDIQTNTGLIVAVEALYLVKVVDATSSWDDVIPIAGRLNTLLHNPGKEIMFGSGSLTCIRERIVQYPEPLDGVQYRHLGATWRIRASRNE